MAILEIEIGLEEQVQLQQEAQSAGMSVSEWSRRRLLETSSEVRAREIQLVQEYHALVAKERQGRLSQAQAERRRQVGVELDYLEAQNPVEQAMDRRLQETSAKLEEVLELLRHLPKKESEPKDAAQ